MPNFSNASKVKEVIRAGDEVEQTRGANRQRINAQANCWPPLEEADARKMGLHININDGGMMTLLQHARLQFLTAFWSQDNFFKVTLPDAPKEFKSEWGVFITEKINSVMRKSLEYFELHNSRWAAVACHGIGPQWWYDDQNWMSDYVAIEDVRVATDTQINFRNLGWIAVRHYYTPGELFKAMQKDDRWDKKSIVNILKRYKELNFISSSTLYDLQTTVEKIGEEVRQNGAWWESNAFPVIPLYHFYFEDCTDPNKSGWFMRVVPETGEVRGTPEEDVFLWTSDEPIAKKREHFCHFQFGDLANKAPFLYHSIRSLGFALMEPCFYDNLTWNRFMQHVHENFNIWLRFTDPAGKSRPAFQEFGNLTAIKDGVNIVPKDQRHQIDAQLVEMLAAHNNQVKQEVSQSYTQQTDTGTKKEQTAFETRVKLEQVNSLMGGLLLKAFVYSSHEYTEICRRFCIRPSSDPDVQKFQEACKKLKIPRVWMDHTKWEIEPMSPIGRGNQTIAQAAVQQLWSVMPAFGPEAQQEIKHDYVLAVTGDARRASRWAPLDNKNVVTQGQLFAQSVFGTLMQGVPIQAPEGMSEIEQIETLLPMMAGVIVRIEQRDNTGTPDEVSGLSNVAQYIGELIQRLSMDRQQKARVKQYQDALGNLMNQLKGIAQRGAEKRQSQNGNNGVDAETNAKLQQQLILAQGKNQVAAMKQQQKDRLDEMRHVREERRKDAGAFAEIQRQNEKNKMKSFSE